MVVKVYGIDGSERRNIDLVDEVFNRPVSTGSIYHAIRNELANLRVGTASTKTRNEVRGSGAKPWRQKGTGRARAGTRQSPLWTGGGVVFGPKPRDYSYKIPKKLKRLAFKSILSQKTHEERLLVVEDFTVESGKTRELVKILKGLTPENRTTIVISGEDSMLKRAGRNVPGLSILSYNRLRAHDLFYAGRVIVFEKAAEQLGQLYGEKSSRRASEKVMAPPAGGAKPVPLSEQKGTAGPKAAAKAASKAKSASAGSKPAAKEKPAGKAKAAPSARAKAPAAKPSGRKASAVSKPAAKEKPAGKASTAGAAAAKAAAKAASKGKAKPATAATSRKPASAGSKPAAKEKPAGKASAAGAAAPKTAGGGAKPSAKKPSTGKGKTRSGKKGKEGT